MNAQVPRLGQASYHILHRVLLTSHFQGDTLLSLYAIYPHRATLF